MSDINNITTSSKEETNISIFKDKIKGNINYETNKGDKIRKSLFY